jgi:Ca2+-binding RTX toxin-like protein
MPIINGTPGDDLLSGTFGDDLISGLAGNDTINDGTIGFDDTDTLDGGDGDDFITINDFRDTVIGGAGFDTLFLGFPPGPGGISVNFFPLWATGSMALGSGSITGIERLGPTVSGTMANDVIVLGANYTYDTSLLGQEGDDILVGGAGNDTLIGFTGADYLIGGAGNDSLDGGTGALNTLQGGLGDDTYTLLNAGDSIVEFAGEGFDRVNTQLNAFVLPTNVEEVRFSNGGTVVGVGNAGDNNIYGSAGADQLFGLDGNDRLYGYDPITSGNAGPANTLLGGLGNDIYYVYSFGDSTIELNGEGIDLVVTNLANHTLQANIEILQYSGIGVFVGVGNELNNSIDGGTGRDTLAGRDGNDTLLGGTGAANELIGGLGDDTYGVSVSGDSLVELAGEGEDTVFLYASSFVIPTNVEHLIYQGTGSATAFGNTDFNRMTGGSGAVTFYGMGGRDEIYGGSGGPNTLFGGTGDDNIYINSVADSVIEYAGEGVDSVTIYTNAVSIPVYTLPANVENLFNLKLIDFTGIGNALDNRIDGFHANDTLFGGNGNDVLSGRDGYDALYGGNGNDTLSGGLGNDRFFFEGGETGVDTITDFTVGTDLIYLRRAGFGATATIDFVSGAGTLAATSANSTLFFHTDTRMISFDADGTGAGAAVDLATVSVGTVISVSDFILY